MHIKYREFRLYYVLLITATLMLPVLGGEWITTVKADDGGDTDELTTTGPIPPPAVNILGFSSHSYSGKEIIQGVPSYKWRHGCGPTAAGMIIGYWDGHGYEELVDGESNQQTQEVNDMIASNEHYADYSLPIDTDSQSILPDKSELPVGDEHDDNCIADFMKTSQSIEENRYGWSWWKHTPNALIEYVHYKNPQYNITAYNLRWGDLTWENFCEEIDSGRPVCLIVDIDGDGETDHLVAAIGHDDNYHYACYTTWDHRISWYDFTQMREGKSWGVYGATFCILSHKYSILPYVYNQGPGQYVSLYIDGVLADHQFAFPNSDIIFNSLIEEGSHDFIIEGDDFGYVSKDNVNCYIDGQYVYVGKLVQTPKPNSVYVDDNYNPSTPGWGVDHFSKIQDGINAVAAEGVVHVYNGVYSEHIEISKILKLNGDNKENTIIDGGGTGIVVNLSGHGISIDNFTVRNGDTGILLDFANGNSLNNITVYDNLHNGIEINCCSFDNIISSCEIHDNIFNGVEIHNCFLRNDIINCDIYNNSNCGIKLFYSSLNCISNCTIHNNFNGIMIKSDFIELWNVGALYLSRAADAFGSLGATCGDQGYDPLFDFDEDCDIDLFDFNFFSTFSYEHVIGHSNRVFNCEVSDNSNDGININGANDFQYNNKFYHNNIMNNTRNACDSAYNIWDNGGIIGGNYWSDYVGSDTNNDGIGDQPYAIPCGNNLDNYPLVRNMGFPAVSVCPALQNITPRANFGIDIIINSNGIPVNTVGFKLSYPTSFNITNLADHQLLGNNVLPVAQSVPGLLDYMVTRLPGNFAKAINGTLFTIYFTAPMTTGSYTLDLHNVVLRDQPGNPISGIVITDGIVNVYSGMPLVAQCNGPYSETVGIPVQFMGSATGGTSPYTYTWDFNYDGTFNTQSTLQNPTYTYITAGTYTVALRVTDSTTATNMCTATAIITNPNVIPTANIFPVSQSITSGDTNVSIQVLINSNGVPVRTVAFKLAYPTNFILTSFTYQNLMGTDILQMGTPTPPSNIGLINYGVSRTDGYADPEHGVLATICFTAPATVGTYTLDLHDVILMDESGNPLTDVVETDGTIIVNTSIVGQTTTVYVDPSTQESSVENGFTIDVNIDPAEAVSGAQFDLSFDSSLLTLDSITEGDLYSGYDTFFNPGTIDNINGKITGVFNVITTQGGSVSSQGTLATIHFTAKGDEGVSSLDLVNVVVGDPGANPVPVVIHNGSVEIISDDAEPPVSSVNPIMPYKSHLKDMPLDITVTATDDESGVKEVSLYYRYSTDNSTWTGWMLYGDDQIASPYTWQFTGPNGTGYYEFYSQAVDNAGNLEPVPVGADAICRIYPDWDVNMDQNINILDIIVIAQHIGETGEPCWIPQDVNCDGMVNVLDIILVAQHWTG